ncbi:translation initiation factor 1 [Pseudoxanthomonas sp. PXM03]|uniref:translation initiation factor 1 n=1 Tax=Pseudoxanthomonas sp. PXM03 TaxID=2769284 RepID=UPI00177B7E16|nr:translation initiation factor 1 [Pseudoxanthomonas sp. PXM03]MBD9435887.1 translation initiation factor 1 [Pseudoxanthomonas sp. PXM03]
MAASNEWEEEHLTPNGWVSGSYKHDNGSGTVAVPADAVLTVRRHVVVPALVALPNVDVTETPHTTDKALIKKLREEFGEPVFGC